MSPTRKQIIKPTRKKTIKHKPKAKPASSIEEDLSSGEYTVHSIREHKGKPGSRRFLVSWMGYPDEDSWVEEDILREDVPHKVIAYLKRKKVNLVNSILQ